MHIRQGQKLPSPCVLILHQPHFSKFNEEGTGLESLGLDTFSLLKWGENKYLLGFYMSGKLKIISAQPSGDHPSRGYYILYLLYLRTHTGHKVSLMWWAQAHALSVAMNLELLPIPTLYCNGGSTAAGSCCSPRLDTPQ